MIQSSPNVYTFMARSVKKPDNFVRFTLDNESVRLDLSSLLAALDRKTELVREQGGPEAADRLERQVRPLAAMGVKKLAGPFPLADLHLGGDGAALDITLWPRLLGLRVAPVNLQFAAVDDPEAADAFRGEVARRQALSARPELLPGPFDYWATWGFVGVLICAMLVAIGRRERR